MDLENSVELLTYLVKCVTPISLLWVLVNRAYLFLLSAFTGGHRTF